MYLIDANIFLELQLDQKRADECEVFLESVHRGSLHCFTTDLVLDSVLIILEAKGKAPSDLETFLTSLASFKGLSFYFLTLLDRLESTRIMRDHQLDFEDSTLVRTARRLKAEGIVSFDQDFDRVNDIKRVEPSEIRKSLR